MSRVKTSLDHKRIRRLIWLVLTVFVLLIYSLQSVAGSAYYSMLMQAHGTVSSPPVVLESGTAGSSIIYTNKTSAKVSVDAPVAPYDYVDNNTSNVDSGADKGTHSNFTAQQYGPDSIYDTLTEGNTGSSSNTTVFSDGFEAGNYNLWTDGGTTTWSDGSGVPATNTTYGSPWLTHSGTYMADCDSTDDGSLTSDNIDMSTATSIWVKFWYMDDDLDGGTDFEFYVFDGTAYDLIVQLNPATEDVWYSYTWTSSDSQYFKSNFRVRFSAMPGFGEVAFIDDVTVNKIVTTINYELDLEVQWTNADYDETNEELAIYFGKGKNTYSLDATGGYMIIGSGTPNWGSVTGTISFWIKWDSVANRPWGQHDNMETRFSVQNLVLDWGAAGSLTSSTSFTNGTWYFIAIVWNENTDNLYLYVGDQNNPPTLNAQNNAWTSTVSTVGVTQNNFMASKQGVNPTDGRGEELRYWNTARTLAQIQSDYNTELTGSETNLRSYFKLNNNFDDIGPNNNDGSGSGSYSFSSEAPFSNGTPTENIRVDVWNGTAWQNLFTNLASGWNHISVSSYLTSSTFTVRFKGNTETGDTAQDNWNIDLTLLHVWTNESTYDYVLRVVNLVAVNWTINLRVYGSSNIARLLKTTIRFHDGSSSDQLIVNDGAITQPEGPSYNLAGNATIYIAINNLQATPTGTSYLYVYLKILAPNTSTYILYVITFEIN